jgi:hypothetical protein
MRPALVETTLPTFDIAPLQAGAGMKPLVPSAEEQSMSIRLIAVALMASLAAACGVDSTPQSSGSSAPAQAAAQSDQPSPAAAQSDQPTPAAPNAVEEEKKPQ